MSRIGRMPIAIPAGVTVTVADENVVTVKGKLGTLTEKFSSRMNIKVEGSEVIITRPTDDKEDKSLHGLTRALLFNMVEGVTNGYSKKLEIVGVGYKVVKQGKTLQLYLGHSLMPDSGLPQARFCMTEEDGITFDVPDANTIIVKGIDKQKVGQTAAVIRGKRPPEPYHGKGVKYAEEHVRRKSGKAGKGK
ncbi:MAG: 50S ribosomal protein L6 [Clostridia bacterium]|nr:50S ribosomal protein L6 [Clostridia bacterium]